MDAQGLVPIKNLITDGFSLEQIWEEIQLQNAPFVQESEKSAKTLIKRKRLFLLQSAKRHMKAKSKAHAHNKAAQKAAAAALSGDEDAESGSEEATASDEEDGVPAGSDEEDGLDVDMGADEDDEEDDGEGGDDDDDENEDGMDLAGDGMSIGSAEDTAPADGDLSSDDMQDGELDVPDVDDEDPPSDVDDVMSAHRAQASRLSRQIESLEKKQLDRKPWQLTGEVSSKQRPKDSLLDAEIEFDQPARVSDTQSLHFLVESLISDVV
jgi:U3 small nucleolar RNA-associated protein MPP10